MSMINCEGCKTSISKKEKIALAVDTQIKKLIIYLVDSLF